MSQSNQSLDPALGYLALGMFEAAWNELEDLPPEFKSTDQVLAIRIGIYQGFEKWTSARILAESLAKHFPENPEWWIQWAYSLRREKSVDEARMVLGQAAMYHPAHATILYNLACYACVAGDVAPARELLKRVFALDGSLRNMALEDPDLEAIFGARDEVN